jgi:hypothetical protein
VCGLCEGADPGVLMSGGPDEPERDRRQVVDGNEHDPVVAEAVLHRRRGGEHDVSSGDEAGHLADRPHRGRVHADATSGGGLRRHHRLPDAVG